MTSNQHLINLMNNIKSRITALLLAMAAIITPSLASADRDDGQMYLQMEKVAEKSGKSALETAAEVLKIHPGYVIGFEADQERSQLVYEYKIMQPADNRVIEVAVNAEDGRILETNDEDIDYGLPRTDKDMKSIMDFADAWRKTEEMFGKFIVEAELDEEHGRLFYEFGILESYRESKVLIDARTGNPIPVFEHR